MALLLVAGWWCRNAGWALSYSQRLLLRDETLEMHLHAYGAYMQHAYPHDELMPLTCAARRWDKRERGTLDDTLGGYMMTLVDGADTLAVMGFYDEFVEAVNLAVSELSFDRDVTVSTFEATIRVLGSLLSLHYLVSEPRLMARITAATHRSAPFDAAAAARSLLALAVDLGERLLPAFETPTGIPAHRVNLQRGVDWSRESRENCVSGAGTMLLEFGRLSRLTHDARFETAARRSVNALWSRRSKRNLVGATVHTHTGRWLEHHTGIGAGVDSFYEYLLKTAVYFDDDDLAVAAHTALRAATNETRYRSRADGLEWNAVVHKDSGQLVSSRISALQAFWPSLLVLYGDISAARRSFASFWALWRKFRCLPEVYDIDNARLISFARDSPLRPELAESAFHLSLATNDPHYLVVGRELIHALQNISRVDCGFASIADAATHRLDDRMDSYFLSESTKYLFLLMDLSLEPNDRKSFFCAPTAKCKPLIEARLANVTATFETCTFDAGLGARPPLVERRAGDFGDLPAACDPARCLPMNELIFTTEGHIFDLRHRVLRDVAFGPFGARMSF